MFVRSFVRVLWGRFSLLINCPRERKSERTLSGPPTHPFSLARSLHSWRERLPPSLSPQPATTTESVVQDFFPSHSAFRDDPRVFFADQEGGRNSAVLTRPSKRRRREKREKAPLRFGIAPIRACLRQPFQISNNPTTKFMACSTGRTPYLPLQKSHYKGQSREE